PQSGHDTPIRLITLFRLQNQMISKPSSEGKDKRNKRHAVSTARQFAAFFRLWRRHITRFMYTCGGGCPTRPPFSREAGSYAMRIRRTANLLGTRSHGPVHAPDHRIWNSGRSRRWSGALSDVPAGDSRRNDASQISEFGSRSAVSISSMGSEPACLER